MALLPIPPSVSGVSYYYGANGNNEFSIRIAGSLYNVEVKVVPSGDTTGAIDTPAIQAAINAMSAAGGGIVMLGRGIFYTNTNITIASNVRLIGKGQQVTIIRFNNQTYDGTGPALNVLQALSVSNVQIKSLTLDFNYTNLAGLTTAAKAALVASQADDRCNALSASSVTNGLMDDVELIGGFFHGIINVGTTSGFTMRGCTSHNNGFRGVHFHSVNGTVVKFNIFDGNFLYQNGVEAFNAGGSNILNSGMFVVFYAESTIISNNIIHDEYGVGLQLGGGSDTSKYVNVTGNQIRNCVQGISFGNVKDIALSNNVVVGCSAFGIIFSGVANNISITGGIIADNIGYGIACSTGVATYNITMTGIDINNNTLGAASIRGSTASAFCDNMCVDNTTASGVNHHVDIIGCINLVCNNNTVVNQNLTSSGAQIVIDSTSSLCDVSYNFVLATATTTGVSNSGTNCRTIFNSGNAVAGAGTGSQTISHPAAGSSWGIGVGVNLPNSKALLDLTSTAKGFLPPRMSTTQKTAISSPPSGLVVYDSTLNKISVYTGTVWETVTSA